MTTQDDSESPLDILVMPRWKCKSCGVVSREIDLLTAPSPFDITDSLTGCPNCKSCSDGFDRLCDEDGCNDESHCGWSTGDKSDRWGGYRITCGLHMATHNAEVTGGPLAADPVERNVRCSTAQTTESEK